VKIGPDGEVLVKGPMISSATWSGGELRQRGDEWLATGDLAETQATGELRFMGRKSETIVTAAGVNVHPEDLEAALEEQHEIAASAVVAVETPSGPEPCAVLVVRGSDKQAAEAVERANAGLAEFQRIRRWMLWPEPDLPRTSTGKVRRKPIAEWVAHHQSADRTVDAGSRTETGPRQDWLYMLLAEISGERPGGDDELRLSEDFHLDSLGRVQLAASLEGLLTESLREGAVDSAKTLGDLRRIVGGVGVYKPEARPAEERERWEGEPDATNRNATQREDFASGDGRKESAIAATGWPHQEILSGEPEFRYPVWPWWRPVQWLRAAFLELIAQPFVWFLGAPRVSSPQELRTEEPVLIICNHVTAYDGALVEYALPGRMRRWVAAAMLGEMLEDFRHFKDPDTRGFMLFGPAAYWLVTALYNVFPLPRRRGFQRSFAHAGEAMDRGYNVLVFPEGTRSDVGQLAAFRQGIGLLVKQTHAPVLPVAIVGLGELKARGRGWFRSGKIEIRLGEVMRFGPTETEAAITEILHRRVADLMESTPTAVNNVP
jgi:long-chain acyl-CoA synthetase